MTGYEGLREGAAWIDLSARGEIRATGEDRARLLHAMSTSHINNLGAMEGLYTFYLNERGRILADAFVYNFGESFLLDTEPETRQKLLDHLDRYIIADDVTLEDETERWAILGLEGPKSLERAAGLGIPAADQKYSVAVFGNGFTTHVASTGPEGIRIFVPVDGKDELVERLRAGSVPEASAAEARIVRLENGIPRYGEEISERYLVQETQAMHAVHPSKGCYLGQEIVERVRSRGQIHRLLSPVRIKSSVPPEPGTKLRADGKDAAEIASAEYSPALGEVAGLAYVRTEVLHHKPRLAVADSDPEVVAYLV